MIRDTSKTIVNRGKCKSQNTLTDKAQKEEWSRIQK